MDEYLDHHFDAAASVLFYFALEDEHRLQTTLDAVGEQLELSVGRDEPDFVIVLEIR